MRLADAFERYLLDGDTKVFDTYEAEHGLTIKDGLCLTNQETSEVRDMLRMMVDLARTTMRYNLAHNVADLLCRIFHVLPEEFGDTPRPKGRSFTAPAIKDRE